MRQLRPDLPRPVDKGARIAFPVARTEVVGTQHPVEDPVAQNGGARAQEIGDEVPGGLADIPSEDEEDDEDDEAREGEGGLPPQRQLQGAVLEPYSVDLGKPEHQDLERHEGREEGQVGEDSAHALRGDIGSQEYGEEAAENIGGNQDEVPRNSICF